MAKRRRTCSELLDSPILRHGAEVIAAWALFLAVAALGVIQSGVLQAAESCPEGNLGLDVARQEAIEAGAGSPCRQKWVDYACVGSACAPSWLLVWNQLLTGISSEYFTPAGGHSLAIGIPTQEERRLGRPTAESWLRHVRVFDSREAALDFIAEELRGEGEHWENPVLYEVASKVALVPKSKTEERERVMKWTERTYRWEVPRR